MYKHDVAPPPAAGGCVRGGRRMNAPSQGQGLQRMLGELGQRVHRTCYPSSLSLARTLSFQASRSLHNILTQAEPRRLNIWKKNRVSQLITQMFLNTLGSVLRERKNKTKQHLVLMIFNFLFRCWVLGKQSLRILCCVCMCSHMCAHVVCAHMSTHVYTCVWTSGADIRCLYPRPLYCLR